MQSNNIKCLLYIFLLLLFQRYNKIQRYSVLGHVRVNIFNRPICYVTAKSLAKLGTRQYQLSKWSIYLTVIHIIIERSSIYESY